MAKRVMSVSTKGLDETLAMLQRITNDTGFISLTLYEGAGFVADEMKKQVKAFKTNRTWNNILGYDENNFYVYDTYGCSYLEKFKSKNNAKILSYKEFKELAKPTDSENKFCICFY